jgi:tetratricopeptide (TPR) repeat protein
MKINPSMAMTKEKDWCAWQRKAAAEPDLAKREEIYRESLRDFPDSAELIYNFANFRTYERKDFDEAEQLYRKALELDPDDSDCIGTMHSS